MTPPLAPSLACSPAPALGPPTMEAWWEAQVLYAALRRRANDQVGIGKPGFYSSGGSFGLSSYDIVLPTLPEGMDLPAAQVSPNISPQALVIRASKAWAHHVDPSGTSLLGVAVEALHGMRTEPFLQVVAGLLVGGAHPDTPCAFRNFDAPISPFAWLLDHHHPNPHLYDAGRPLPVAWVGLLLDHGLDLGSPVNRGHVEHWLAQRNATALTESALILQRECLASRLEAQLSNAVLDKRGPRF